MEGESDIDWEELAIKLARENRDLKKRVCELEEEIRHWETEKKVRIGTALPTRDWSKERGGADEGMPILISKCTPAERDMLFRRAQQKIEAGVWTGELRGKARRPLLSYEPQLHKDEEDQGIRPKKINKTKNWREQHKAVFFVTHIVLVGNGFFPAPFDVASHLCHNNKCVKVAHLTWEPHGDNIRREQCNHRKECVCGLKKKCFFDCK